jgi:hypothetical protein
MKKVPKQTHTVGFKELAAMDSKHGLQVEHNLLARDSLPTVAN